MSRVKAQLREFYAAQGLQGKHRRKAMQYDLKQVKKLRQAFGDWEIIALFNWNNSPQGRVYWRDRHWPSI